MSCRAARLVYVSRTWTLWNGLSSRIPWRWLTVAWLRSSWTILSRWLLDSTQKWRVLIIVAYLRDACAECSTFPFSAHFYSERVRLEEWIIQLICFEFVTCSRRRKPRTMKMTTAMLPTRGISARMMRITRDLWQRTMRSWMPRGCVSYAFKQRKNNFESPSGPPEFQDRLFLNSFWRVTFRKKRRNNSLLYIPPLKIILFIT